MSNPIAEPIAEVSAIKKSFGDIHAVHRKFPSNIRDKDGRPLLSWRVAILPYLEESKLYDEFHLDEAWDSDHNIQLLSKMPPIYSCPNLTLDKQTVYLGFHQRASTKLGAFARPLLNQLFEQLGCTLQLVPNLQQY